MKKRGPFTVVQAWWGAGCLRVSLADLEIFIAMKFALAGNIDPLQELTAIGSYLALDGVETS